MRHLYNVCAQVLRLDGQMLHGTPTLSWTPITEVVDPVWGIPGQLMLRLDLGFQRPGKDQPMPLAAGRAPDRIGVAVFDTTTLLKAGDRLLVLTGQPTGTFEIRSIPDVAVGFTQAHHMEVQVVEVAQALTGIFPGSTVEL